MAIIVQIVVLCVVTRCSLIGRSFGGRYCLPHDNILWTLKSNFFILFSHFSCCHRQCYASSRHPTYLIDHLPATCQNTLTTSSVLKLGVMCLSECWYPAIKLHSIITDDTSTCAWCAFWLLKSRAIPLLHLWAFMALL